MQQRPLALTSFPSLHSQDAPLTRQKMQPASQSTAENHPANPKPVEKNNNIAMYSSKLEE